MDIILREDSLKTRTADPMRGRRFENKIARTEEPPGVAV
jgi:hypothetical protein